MFNEVFSQERDISHWYWKYRDNPYGSHIISLALSQSGILAVHYGGYPVRLYLCSSVDKPPEEFMTYHIGDKMTRREFRSAGFGKNAVLTKTFMHFKEMYADKQGVPFAYGFTTHHSKRFGILFLNYADIEPVPYRKFDLGMVNNFRVSRLKASLLRLRVEEISEIDNGWTEFFYRGAPDYKYLVKRDTTYLRWRYLQRPDRKYLILLVKKGAKIAGWSVFYREANKIIWGDALFSPGDLNAVKSILSYLCTHQIAKGADFIECWFPPRPEWWDILLQTLGFKMEIEPNNLHLTPPIFTDSGVTEDLKKYFYYTIGDSDLF